MRGIHRSPLCGLIQRGPVNSPHKWPVTWKIFPFDDVIMSASYSACPNITACSCSGHLSCLFNENAKGERVWLQCGFCIVTNILAVQSVPWPFHGIDTYGEMYISGPKLQYGEPLWLINLDDSFKLFLPKYSICATGNEWKCYQNICHWHEICTCFFVLYSVGDKLVSNGLMYFLYPNSSGWCHWHWGNNMITPVPVK